MRRRYADDMIRLVAIMALATATPAAAKGAPYFEGRTAKPAKEVAACVNSAWHERAAKVRTEVEGNSYRVVMSGASLFGGTDMVATIGSDGAVTMTRRKAIWGKLDDQQREALAACL